MEKDDSHFTAREKEDIIRKIIDVLKEHQVNVRLSKTTKSLKFRFPSGIHRNQIDLVQFFTVVRFIEFSQKSADVTATIKEGYVSIAEKVVSESKDKGRHR